MKIISLGKSGCGKTVYLAGLIHTLLFNSTTDFLLNEKRAAGLLSPGFNTLQDIHTSIYVNREFPSGTSSTSTFSFDFSHSTPSVTSSLDISFTDPIGGDFKLLSRGDQTAHDRVYSKLTNTDAILIFVDSMVLMEENNTDVVKEKLIEQEITRIVLHVCQSRSSHTKLYFIVSKTDSDKTSSYNNRDIEEKLKFVFQNLYTRLNRDIPIYCVSAVGKGNVITNSQGIQEIQPNRELKTFNITKSFFRIVIDYLDDELNKNISQINWLNVQIEQQQREYDSNRLMRIVDHCLRKSKKHNEIVSIIKERDSLMTSVDSQRNFRNLLFTQYNRTTL